MLEGVIIVVVASLVAIVIIGVIRYLKRRKPLNFSGFLLLSSERGDSNARPLRPERSALPTALLSDCVAKVGIIFNLKNKFDIFLIKICRFKKYVYLCTRNRETMVP